MATVALPGFRVADGQPKPRLIISVEGLDKSGKNNFAFGAPGPIGYLNFDIGDEGVIEKFQDKKQILVPTNPYSTRFENDGKQKAEATKEYTRFKNDYLLSLKRMRSTIVDTASETWELLRLARLGKLTQVMPHHYVEVNQEYRDLIREAFDNDSNLILLHKLKAEWKNGADGKGNKTGRFERAGFAETGFLVMINLRMWREEIADREEGDLGFRCQVLNCRQNPEIQGLVLMNEMISFGMIGSMVYPEMDPSVWED
jgi:hypothetical protein